MVRLPRKRGQFVSIKSYYCRRGEGMTYDAGLGPSCFGKQAFDNQGEAIASLRRRGRKFNGNSRGRINAYRCACGSWHVGSFSL